MRARPRRARKGLQRLWVNEKCGPQEIIPGRPHFLYGTEGACPLLDQVAYAAAQPTRPLGRCRAVRAAYRLRATMRPMAISWVARMEAWLMARL
jgi:hypothetical protein